MMNKIFNHNTSSLILHLSNHFIQTCTEHSRPNLTGLGISKMGSSFFASLKLKDFFWEICTISCTDFNLLNKFVQKCIVNFEDTKKDVKILKSSYDTFLEHFLSYINYKKLRVPCVRFLILFLQHCTVFLYW